MILLQKALRLLLLLVLVVHANRYSHKQHAPRRKRIQKNSDKQNAHARENANRIASLGRVVDEIGRNDAEKHSSTKQKGNGARQTPTIGQHEHDHAERHSTGTSNNRSSKRQKHLLFLPVTQSLRHYRVLREDFLKVGDHSLSNGRRTPISTESETQNDVEDEHPHKVVDCVKSHRIGQILHGDLVGAPRNHGHDRQTQGNPVVVRNQHCSESLSNCVELYSSVVAVECNNGGRWDGYHRYPFYSSAENTWV